MSSNSNTASSDGTTGTGAAASWQDTIESKLNSIVSIKFIRPFTFETENRGTSQATGFIVDANNGIILTNRH
ncbi:hypothetical protein GGF41_007818, partial [Coemansia sp. RSA 2531]